jgi:hypothetical protein
MEHTFEFGENTVVLSRGNAFYLLKGGTRYWAQAQTDNSYSVWEDFFTAISQPKLNADTDDGTVLPNWSDSATQLSDRLDAVERDHHEGCQNWNGAQDKRLDTLEEWSEKVEAWGNKQDDRIESLEASVNHRTVVTGKGGANETSV